MTATVDIPYAAQPQQAAQLCWAAATQIVADALGHPAEGHPGEQATIAAYAWASPTQAAAWQARLQICNKDIADCDCSFQPVLKQVGFTYLSSSALSPAYLTADLIVTDIQAGRPIIFGWRYSQNASDSAHFMVITGYTGDAQAPKSLKLHIYDPLPLGQGSVQSISLKNYTVKTPVELQNDMGKPHELMESYYQIQWASAQAPAPPLPLAGPTAPGPSAAPRITTTAGIDPRLAIEASLSEARAEVSRRESEDHTQLSAGFPLPIIALGLNELRTADLHALLGLLRRNTGTLLYPIETGERVRDSFLMIKRGDEWIAGGYANTTVTRRLVWQRQQYAKTQAELAAHYLLSVPALGAFFLARGTGADARLIPVSEDRSIRIGADSLQANKPYRADQLMPALAQAARNARVAPHGESRSR